MGFITRVMIDRRQKRQGFGRAATLEVIRRLRLHPEVEMIVASHRHDNAAAAAFFRGLGFVPWDVKDAATLHPGEVFLRLPD